MEAQLDLGLKAIPGAYLVGTRDILIKDTYVIVAVVRVPNSITPDITAKHEASIPKRGSRLLEIQNRSLLTKETTADG